MRIIAVCCVFILSFISSAYSNNADDEEAKIAQLISFIEKQPTLRFIRNGSEYSSQKAAEHLRSKRESAGKRIKTAAEFIDYIASNSYFSGKPYLIKFPDGKIVPLNSILKEELAKIEKKK